MDHKKINNNQDQLLTMLINMIHYWEEFKIKGIVSIGGETVFDRLVEKKIIGDPREQKFKKYYAKKMQEAKELLQVEYQELSLKHPERRNDYRIVINTIKDNTSDKTYLKCKCEVVKDYFQSLESKKINFLDVLREKWDLQIIENSDKNPL